MSTPSTSETVRADDEAGTEERILEAALLVFSRKGKDGARMREIADLAGINKALLHYYFRSKDRLYESVFEHVIAKLLHSFGSTLQQAPNFETMIRTFVANYIDFIDGNLPAMRLVVTEHLAGGHRVAHRIGSLMSVPTTPPRFFLDRLNEAMDRGDIRRVDPHQTLVTVISSCVFFFLVYPTVEALVPLAGRDRRAFVEQRKDHVTDLILMSLRPDDRTGAPQPRQDSGSGR